MDAVEARVEVHDRVLDKFRSDVGDAQTVAGQVLARLETLDRIDGAVRLTREDLSATRARLSIVMWGVGVAVVAALGVLAKLAAG